jgi:predicted house-cleaning noncanonical NTP pyrophosphatase (MazG superfamily)
MWYKKLVRDLIPRRIDTNGNAEIAIVRVLDDEEYGLELRYKLLEESHEAIEADQKGDAQGVLEECADIYEVIDALLRRHNLTRAQLLIAQDQKREERGGFENRIFLIGVEARP